MKRGTVAALLAVPALFLAFAFFRPLLATLTAADAEAWRWAASHPLVHSRLLGAAWMASLSVALTLALALPLAWFHHTRLPRTRAPLAIHAAPFVLPVFVVVFGIQATLGADGWSERTLGINILSAVGPLGSVVIAHAYYNYGFAARLLHAALERRPRRLEAAARVLGASPRAAALRTTIPLLLPSILAVAVLVWLFAFSSFGVVLYLGDNTVSTLETLLYENLRGAFPRRNRAAVLGILQLAANSLLLIGYLVLIRRQTRLPREPIPDAPERRRDRTLAWLLAAIGALPALAMLLGGLQVRGEWSLEPWRALLDPNHAAHIPGLNLAHAIGLSLLYAAASMTLALALTLMLGYSARRLGAWPRTLLHAVAALPLGASSLLIGFGILLTYGVTGFLDVWTGRVLIIAAHALVAFPFTARALLPALEQHDASLDEAAALVGTPPLGIVGRIHTPLLRAPLVAAAGLAAAMSLGDFGASLLLQNAQNRSLSVWIGSQGLTSFDPLVRAQVVALAGLLMILTALALVAVERFGDRA